MQIAASTNAPVAIAFAPSATLWLRLSVIYLILGVGLGIAMGVSQDFTLRPVQASSTASSPRPARPAWRGFTSGCTTSRCRE
jgi:hypothetical protein